ncbi:energy transducer TonB [Nostoc sp. 'Peltigera membranacea cyanobiont' N6]|uniref:energy transducer TonB n=1 Tax=Nostoc sp. 'Peltigera membranacea cyanobiont' N6 TaxID=1261031 RepID=UPI000CF30C13|nr:energy transducer TonB [Nostoc sp. 'Peltigera membranacea cyanobiont' N6]AVH64115.1 TonB family C-terminal domain protein [Nostoc sp. 'Peltigera membranacea cyanobiont' N6]
MASFDEFVCNRSVRSVDMIFGVVISILLHSILLIGSKYWHRALIHEPKQEISQEIPIQIVEVPDNKTDIPPETSIRASKNSLAGGKAFPERPISLVKSGYLGGHKADNARSSDLTASSPLKVFQAGRQQQKMELPNLSGQQPQLKSPKTASSAHVVQVSNSQKITVAPVTRSQAVPLLKTASLTTPLVLNPKQVASVSATKAQVPNFKKNAFAPTITASATPLRKIVPLTRLISPNSKQIASAPTSTAQVRNFKRNTVVAITTPPSAQLGKTALERATTLPAPNNPKKLGQSRIGFSGRTPTQAESSLKTGAASLLGGTVGVSSQNYRGDQLAAVPNSNRDRPGASGIDTRSLDIDLTSYLNKLKQRVQQQWLPGMSQSNRRTVLNFTINRSGQVSNLNIVQTSGFNVTDEVALNAIQRSAPFAPLPTGYTKNYIDIEFTFSINVYGELNLSRDGG